MRQQNQKNEVVDQTGIPTELSPTKARTVIVKPNRIPIEHQKAEDKFVVTKELKNKIIAVCNQKIAQKGTHVGLSFYAFFANKNDNPELLMEAATWWILTQKLDHFEKAVKIKELVQDL